MKLIPVKTPKIVKSLFPRYTWNVNTLQKELYLTFDDGPTPEITEWVLSTLKAYKAKATFFCVGNNIKKHPELFQKLIQDQHTVGNHTFNHLKGWKTATAAYLEDVEETQQLIEHYRNRSNPKSTSASKLFRPPYGKFSATQSKQLLQKDYTIVLWDVLAFDWDRKLTEERCFKNICTNAKEGSIVVLHDSQKASKNLRSVLPKVLEYYSNLGYQFKAL